MGLIIVLLAWIGSLVPLFLLPVNSGGWLLVAILAGAISAFLGSGLVSLQALSDNVGLTYYLWWIAAIVIAGGGAGLLIYSVAKLLWRGAGIDIDVSVHQ